MSAAQAETFSPHNITVLIGLLMIAIFLGEVVIGPKSDDVMMSKPADTMEDIALRLKPVVSLADIRDNMTMASAAGASANKSPDQLYQGACLACHTDGVVA